MCDLAAVGTWREARNDPAAALERDKAAPCLGSAGVKFRFDRKSIRRLMGFMTEQLAS